MTEEQKLPWPGYRLREGWRILEVGEEIVDGDVCTDRRNAPTMGWIESGRIGDLLDADSGNAYCRRTRPDAELPPVEPFPVDEEVDKQNAEFHICELNKIIASVQRERNELRKQVEALKGKFGRLTCERDELQQLCDALILAVEALTKERDEALAVIWNDRTPATNAAPARDWRAELRPCWVRHHAEDTWKQAWLHGWYDAPEGRWAWAEEQNGIVNVFACIRFTDPNTKGPTE